VNLKKILFGGTLLCLVAAAGGCGKSDKVMPITKDNINSYRNKLVQSRDKMTVKDREEAKKSREGSKKLFAQTFVEPLEELGFSYDKTVKATAEKMVEGKMADVDPETRQQAQGLVLMAKSTSDFAVQNGFIALDTKKVLDRVKEQ